MPTVLIWYCRPAHKLIRPRAPRPPTCVTNEHSFLFNYHLFEVFCFAMESTAGPGQSTVLPISFEGSTSNKSALGPSSGRQSHSRSCTFCRSRKVKCNRQNPCGSCVRAGNICSYPPGPGRAPKKPRRNVDARVLDRLSRLETIMKQFDTGEDKNRPPEDSNPEQDDEIESKCESSSTEQRLGRLVIDDTRSCYVSNVMWTSLSDEVSWSQHLRKKDWS